MAEGDRASLRIVRRTDSSDARARGLSFLDKQPPTKAPRCASLCPASRTSGAGAVLSCRAWL